MARRYLATYASLILFGLLGVFGLNWLTDPLWYGRGNRLSHKNFPFDERASKTNLFLRSNPEDYDCIIFGSSRGTLLRSSQFTENSCFNYAFSGSSIEEYIPYAQFVAERNPNIKKVYLGIDPENFKPSAGPEKFEVKQPDSIYRSYLSFDLFMFSIDSLLNPMPGPRYYNSQRNFESETVNNWPAYKPGFDMHESDQACDRDKVNRYGELAALFPNAEVIGFAAPVSSWHVINQLYAYGDVLDCYLEATHQLAQEFTAVYDFTMPSPTTQDPSKSYNGGHYYSPTIDRLIARIQQGEGSETNAQTGESAFGTNPRDYSLEEYKSRYLAEIENFLVASDRTDLWQGEDLNARVNQR